MKDRDWDQINRHVAEKAKKLVEKAANPYKEKACPLKLR